MNFFYNWLVDAKSKEFLEDIMNMIDILNKYGIHNNVEAHSEEDGLFIIDDAKDKGPHSFVLEKNGKTETNIFYGNLHIRVSISENEKIYSVHIKLSDDKWAFKMDEKNKKCDFSHPHNMTYRVYAWWDIPVLDITRSIGDVYNHGNWDGYVYQTFRELVRSFCVYTDRYQFNEDYKKTGTYHERRGCKVCPS